MRLYAEWGIKKKRTWHRDMVPRWERWTWEESCLKIFCTNRQPRPPEVWRHALVSVPYSLYSSKHSFVPAFPWTICITICHTKAGSFVSLRSQGMPHLPRETLPIRMAPGKMKWHCTSLLWISRWQNLCSVLVFPFQMKYSGFPGRSAPVLGNGQPLMSPSES